MFPFGMPMMGGPMPFPVGMPIGVPVMVRPGGLMPGLPPPFLMGLFDSDSDTDDESFEKDRDKRLAKGPVKTLYHQTDEKAAQAIIKAQKFLRGSGGYAGGGIYFATNAKATYRKARTRGVILTATVKLGRIKTQSDSSDNNFSTLAKKGYDSVKVTSLSSGVEYVVYNYDQCSNIKLYRNA